MIGKVAAAVIGAKIDRSDGEGGVKGAILGIIAESALRRVLPAALVLGGAYALKRAIQRRQTASA
jgi:hypothetical protein